MLALFVSNANDVRGFEQNKAGPPGHTGLAMSASYHASYQSQGQAA